MDAGCWLGFLAFLFCEDEEPVEDTTARESYGDKKWEKKQSRLKDLIRNRSGDNGTNRKRGQDINAKD